MKKRGLFIIPILGLITVLSGCGKDPIISRWKVTDMIEEDGTCLSDVLDEEVFQERINEIGSVIIVFNENNQFAINFQDEETTGSWKTVTSTDETKTNSYLLTSDEDEDTVKVYFKDKDYSKLYMDSEFGDIIFEKE